MLPNSLSVELCNVCVRVKDYTHSHGKTSSATRPPFGAARDRASSCKSQPRFKSKFMGSWIARLPIFFSPKRPQSLIIIAGVLYWISMLWINATLIITAYAIGLRILFIKSTCVVKYNDQLQITITKKYSTLGVQ